MDDLDPFAEARVPETSIKRFAIVDAAGVSLPVLLSDAIAVESTSKTPLPDKAVESDDRNLVKEHVAHVRDDPLAFAQQMGAWATGAGWRSYSSYIVCRLDFEDVACEC